MRTIVLTGVTGLIGRVLLKHFVASGDVVVGIGRSSDSLHKLQSELNDRSRQFRGISVDLSLENACDQIKEALLSADLWPNCLINNARDVSYLRLGTSGTVARQDFFG